MSDEGPLKTFATLNPGDYSSGFFYDILISCGTSTSSNAKIKLSM